MSERKSDWHFHVEARASGVLEISVYDVIGDSLFGDGVSAKDVLAALNKNPSAKTIRLRINSVGGILDDAKAMVNLLNARRKSGATVEAHIDGIAASSAAYLTVAADTVFMPQNAFLMVHETRAMTFGTATQLENRAVLLRRENEKMATAFSGVSARRGKGKTTQDFLDSFAKGDRYLDADEAIDWGLADEKVDAIDIAACLADVSDLANAPEALTSAPYATIAASAQPQARVGDLVAASTPEPQPPASQGTTASADPGGADQPQDEDSMNLAELKEKHPGVYAEAFAEGKTAGVTEGTDKERKRCKALRTMAKTTGADDVADEAIESGASLMDDDVQAGFQSAAYKRNAVAARQEDDDAAAAAVSNAAPAPEPTEDFGDKVVAALNAQGGF